MEGEGEADPGDMEGKGMYIAFMGIACELIKGGYWLWLWRRNGGKVGRAGHGMLVGGVWAGNGMTLMLHDINFINALGEYGLHLDGGSFAYFPIPFELLSC